MDIVFSMDYSNIGNITSKMTGVENSGKKSVSVLENTPTDFTQRGITEFSKEASDALSAASKAAINIQRTDQPRRYVAKGAIDPSLEYIRRRLLDKAGIFEDESISELTRSVVQSDVPKTSKFLPAKALNIENFAITTDDAGIRGGSLFSKKGRKIIARLHDLGIKRVIDLRTDGDPIKYKEICAKSGLEYMKFPIAYDEKWTQENIDKIPDFIETMKKGDFYIGCATGLHRTDIGIALNYFFNPKPDAVPRLEAGTTKNKMIAIANKIFSSINDICYVDRKKTVPRLSEEFASKLGWDSLQQLLDEIPIRKAILSQVNKIL